MGQTKLPSQPSDRFDRDSVGQALLNRLIDRE